MPSPEFVAFLAQLQGTPRASELQAQRAASDGMGEMFPLEPGATVERVILGGRPAEWYDPSGGRTRHAVILYLHGGGYSIGSLNSHRHLGAEIAQHTDVSVVALDYRRAPEHPFPAALDDAMAAYLQLVQDYPNARIAVAGDSAGGGLGLAIMLIARERGVALPVCAYCISPWVDLAVRSESARLAADPLATEELLRLMAQRYLGALSPETPLASPLYADLRGLSPILVQVGSADALLDDSLRLAHVGAKANVRLTLDVWPDMFHVWPFFFRALPEGRQALSRGCAFLREHLLGAPG